MRPIKSKTATGNYGAPSGLEAGIGGLPFWRETQDIAGHKISTVYSAWKLEPWEIEVLAKGGALILGIVGMEPIPPVSLGVADAEEGRAQEVHGNEALQHKGPESSCEICGPGPEEREGEKR